MNAEYLLNRTIAQYRLLEILGQGGMSVVFSAQHREDPQDMKAIKLLLPSGSAAGDELATFQARFKREAQAVHQLRHEHILPVLDYGEEEDGLFYMIMPLITGGTLTQLLASTAEPLPLDEIASYLNQLASAVDYSNQHGMVHRDIKSSNVLIDENKNVYLSDFGIVRLFDSSHLALDETPRTLTATGRIYGTPAYMAPERFQGEPAEPATDLYALGILLYQLVTGQVPFEASNALALGMKHLNEEPVRPRALRPDLPEPSEAAILKALAKQPAERFTSASALAIAFETGLQGEWVTELLPLAASLRDGLESPSLVASAASIEEAARPVHLGHDLVFEASGSNIPMVVPAILEETISNVDWLGGNPASATSRGNPSIAGAPTVVNMPATVRHTHSSRGNLQAFSLGMLVIVLLVFSGLFALAVMHLGTPPGPQSPGIHIVPTSTKSSPTKNGATPISPSGGAPSPGHTSTPTISPTPTTGSTSTPTPGNTPVPTTPPTPVPTIPPTPTTPSITPTNGEVS